MNYRSSHNKRSTDNVIAACNWENRTSSLPVDAQHNEIRVAEMICGYFCNTWRAFLRCGTATRWRTSSWARWFCRARWRTPSALRGSSWGREDDRWRTRCRGPSVWGSSLLLSWPPCDPVSDFIEGFFTMNTSLGMCHHQSPINTLFVMLDVHAFILHLDLHIEELFAKLRCEQAIPVIPILMFNLELS